MYKFVHCKNESICYAAWFFPRTADQLVVNWKQTPDSSLMAASSSQDPKSTTTKTNNNKTKNTNTRVYY